MSETKAHVSTGLIQKGDLTQKVGLIVIGVSLVVIGLIISLLVFSNQQKRLKIMLADGRTLTGIPDESLDLVVSFQVLQHIPDKEVIRDYIADSFRALRPGGYARLHVKTKPWKGAGPTPNTWDGVNVGHEDKDIWLADRPWHPAPIVRKTQADC